MMASNCFTAVIFEYISFRLETKECASEITMNMIKLSYLVSMRCWHVPTPQQVFSNAFFSGNKIVNDMWTKVVQSKEYQVHVTFTCSLGFI